MNLRKHSVNCLLVMSLIMASCSQKNKQAQDFEAQQKQQEQILAQFELANMQLDQKNFEKAAQMYDQLVVTYPANPMDSLILFNSGLAHLMNKNCEFAVERFRKVVRLKSGQVQGLLGRSLLRLSDSYVCLGQDDKAIVTLVQLYRSKTDLPDELRYAELPARLAAAYARLGNRKDAEYYFRQSERGLTLLHNRLADLNDRRELLARTLFLMGNLSQINPAHMSSDDFFTTMKALQKYLYKAVELNEKNWSEQAAEQIISAYQQGWSYMDKIPLSSEHDQEVAYRNQVRAKLEVAQLVLTHLTALYRERLPDENEPEMIKNLFSRLRNEERKYRNFIATHIIGTNLTAEALVAEGLKRAGRVYNPDPILEEKAKKQKKKKND